MIRRTRPTAPRRWNNAMSQEAHRGHDPQEHDAQQDHELMDELEAGEAAVELDDKEPQEVLAWTIERFGNRMGLCSSFQADGCVLIDMAWRIDPSVRVFTIDTGRMPEETYALIERVRERYGIKTEVFLPDTKVVEHMVSKHGLNLFYRDVNLRLLCCQVRKVPPLADWTDEEVWDYIRANDVPYNELYDKGYKSIGCAPCTRAVPDGADSREGRWWWETGAPKECGMHCAIETGGFEHELAALLGSHGAPSNGSGNGSGSNH